jgi:type I restriction enzyme, S subunit
MSGWETRRLGALLGIQNGFAFDSKRFSSTAGKPLIRIRDLKGGISTEARYDGEYDSRYVVRSGDYLIGMDGEFGCYEWRGEDALLNQRVCKLQPFDKALDGRFLFYGINKHLKAIEEVTGFTTVKHLSSKQIADIAFAFPPLAEQRRIVGILDEAFAGLATMRANAEANLKNARALFDSHLNAVFSEGGEGWENKRLQDVSMEFGRGRSRHRPRNAEFLYGGPYPFIQTGDVRNSDHVITEFSQTYSEAGLAQSKLWPAGTICITIAANIAETGILTFDACFPDSVIGIVVDPTKTTNAYVEFLLQSVRARLKAEGKGSAQDNINLATFEDARFPFPSLARQTEIVETLSAIAEGVRTLETIGRQKLAAIDFLKQSILAKAFAGELTKITAPAPANDNNLRSAIIIALAFARHRAAGAERSFGHTKEQKIMHVVECHSGFDLGRNPQKDAAGPNDFQHMLKVEAWAEANRHFRVFDTGKGYRLETLDRFDALLRKVDMIDPDTRKVIDRVIAVFLPMGMREAELFATVYAAWNNLLIDGEPDTDDAIIREAREDWHPKKANIPRPEFVTALAEVRRSALIPTGKGKRVGERQLRLA